MTEVIRFKRVRYDRQVGSLVIHYGLAMWLILSGEHKGELYVPRER